MTLSHLGTPPGRHPVSTPCKPYDERAGATVLRRAGKAVRPDLRGDQTAALLAARRKEPVRALVASDLNDFYQAMLREPVPTRFIKLLDALEAQSDHTP